LYQKQVKRKCLKRRKRTKTTTPAGERITGIFFNHVLLGEVSASKAEEPGSNPGVVALF
jgi:hypothetical protein